MYDVPYVLMSLSALLALSQRAKGGFYAAREWLSLLGWEDTGKPPASKEGVENMIRPPVFRRRQGSILQPSSMRSEKGRLHPQKQDSLQNGRAKSGT